MKLKRILSLALSGVLAVSMLTACGGFGGGSGNRVVNVSAAFRTTLNNQLDDLEQATVNFDGKSSKLARATRAVAEVVTVDDLEKVDGNMSGAIVQPNTELQTVMSRNVGDYDHWTDNFGKYNPAGTDYDRDATFVTAILFDGGMNVDGVARAVANYVKAWDLEALNKAEKPAYTFKYHAEAFQVTIPGETSGEGEDAKTEPDTTVWVVGLMLEQTKVQA